MGESGIKSPDLATVRAQLERMIASDDFTATSRNRRFLEFVVDETLAGRRELIKAYTIATSVFGRGADFDPQFDSIVRIEAGRLRRALEHYYLTGGRTDPVIISIPKGSYVPEFAVRVPAGEAPPPGRVGTYARQGASVLVPGFEEEGDQSAFPNLTRGFTRHVVAGLARFTDLTVYGPDTSAFQSGQPQKIESDVDYLVTGGTTITATRFGAEALLLDVRTGRCLWGDVFERPIQPGGLAWARDTVAGEIVRALAQPYGAIFVAQSRDIDTAAAGSSSSCASILLFRRYARTFDRSLQETVRRALEAAIVRDPDYAEAFTCLSQVYTDILRFGIDPGPDAADRAFALARRAIELAPNSSRSHHALSRAYWFTGETAASFEELEVARALNPYDTGVLADFGQQYAVMADWAKAIPLLEAAYAQNPGLPSSYHVGFALFHFAHGRFDAALAEARKIDVSGVIYGHLMVAVCAIRLGREAEALRAVATILEIDPDYADHAAADLARRNVEPDLAATLLAALGDAGLPSSPAPRRAPHLRSVG